MTTRLIGLAAAGLVFTLVFGTRTAFCEGWSLNPFASSDASANKKMDKLNGTKAEPSTLDKLGTGTKKFVSGVGNTLTLKKTPPKQQMPTNPWIKPAKEEPKPNWFTSKFYKEKPKPKSPKDWLSQPRPE